MAITRQDQSGSVFLGDMQSSDESCDGPELPPSDVKSVIITIEILEHTFHSDNLAEQS